MADFNENYEALRASFEDALHSYLAGVTFKPKILDESFRYSLQLGGKRVRPVMMFAAAQMLGGKITDVSARHPFKRAGAFACLTRYTDESCDLFLCDKHSYFITGIGRWQPLF